MSEGELTDCPECKRPTLKRLVSAPAFRLKGSGWYETDFKKDNRRNLADESAAGTPGKASGSSDTKTTDTTTSGGGTEKTETKPAATSAGKE